MTDALFDDHGHAVLSPSSSYGWMSCAGRVWYIKYLQDLCVLPKEEKSSDPARRGTALHYIGETHLINHFDGYDNIPDMRWEDGDGKIHELTDEEVEREVMPYVNRIIERELQPDIEMRVHIHDLCWGTADSLQPDMENRILYVDDLKTGHGKVESDSPQLKLYALGAVREYALLGMDFDEVHATIHQDRIGHCHTSVYTAAEIEEFAQEVDAAIQAVIDAEDNYSDNLVPTKKGCQWCPARAHCPAYEQFALEFAHIEFREMTLEQLGEAHARIPALKAWITGVEDALKTNMEQGNKVPGYKMVQGRRRTAYLLSEEDVEAYLKNRLRAFKTNAYQAPKLKTPAQLKATIKKAEKNGDVRGRIDLDHIIGMVGGPPTIAPEDDPREELVEGDRAAADFAEFKDE